MKKHVTNIPKRRFKGFTDAWEQRKLGDVLRFQNGFNGGREAYGAGTAFISVMDILNNQFITYDCIRGKATVTDDEIERFSVRYGDVLFQRSSENVEDAGTSNVYVDNEKTAIFGGFVIRGRQVAPYSPRFMKYLLDTKAVRNQITKKAQGAQHVNVSQETLQDVQITLPSQKEQEAVEGCLCNLDNLITLQQHKLAKLQNLKKAYLAEMFPAPGEKVPRRRFAGFTGDWEQRKLDDVVDFLDTMRKPLEEATRVARPYPYYGASGIVDYVDGYIFDEELVLLSEDGANITDRNYPVCFLASGKYWVNNHAHVLRVKEGNENNFICNSLERKDFNQYNSGMAMPKLNKEVCKGIPITCPLYDEQKKIGDYFRNLDKLITLQQRKLAKLQNLKKAYLAEMFPDN